MRKVIEIVSATQAEKYKSASNFQKSITRNLFQFFVIRYRQAEVTQIADFMAPVKNSTYQEDGKQLFFS